MAGNRFARMIFDSDSNDGLDMLSMTVIIEEEKNGEWESSITSWFYSGSHNHLLWVKPRQWSTLSWLFFWNINIWKKIAIVAKNWKSVREKDYLSSSKKNL